MPQVKDKSDRSAYLGKLTVGNFFDWIVTIALGLVIIQTTTKLGGVRADTHMILVPLFCGLLVLHGIWFLVENEKKKKISHIPLLFIPFLALAWLSLFFITPTVWRGWYELILATELFIFFWVLVNNVRARGHMWAVLAMAALPVLYGAYLGIDQFFQNQTTMADAMTLRRIRLSPDVLGRATGSFADAHSFAVLLLMSIPVTLILGLVPKFSIIVRILFLYAASMLIGVLFFTQTFWPFLLFIPLLLFIPWLCYQKHKSRFAFFILGATVIAICVTTLFNFKPSFEEAMKASVTEEGEAVRLKVWSEAWHMAMESPIIGKGVGSFSSNFEQSPRTYLANLPLTPENDYLLILSQYGFVGFLLLLIPVAFVVFVAFRTWHAEPYRVRLKLIKGVIVSPKKLFLAIGLGGFITFLLTVFLNFGFHVPALYLYAACFFALLVKLSFVRRVKMRNSLPIRLGYLVICCGLALLFYSVSLPRLESQAITLHARHQLDEIVARNVHLSGNSRLLENVVKDFKKAVELDPQNADAWIGLSAASIQGFFKNPARFVQIGQEAAQFAQKAVEITETYWLGWAQLGIAHAMAGNTSEAEPALKQALRLAPNNSNAHYYMAAFVSEFPDRRTEAIAAVQRALEINPENGPARRLEQKLLIL